VVDSARAIENLLYSYAERLDAGDLEGVADLFANGRIAAPADATTQQVFEGRDGVLGMYQAATRLYEDNGTPHTKHITTNAIIEADEGADAGLARSYYTVMQQTDALPLQPIISGRYHDTFKRIDSTWWFDTRIMFVDLVGDLSHHLLYELR
jgi:ketosteroid isomerase-like protein